MLHGFLILLKAFIECLKYPIYALLLMLAIFIFNCTIFAIIFLFKGRRFKKGEHNKLKKVGLLKKLFILIPRQFIDDMFEKSPDFFRYQGLVIFEGRQGSGKTISMVKFIQDMQYEYPLSKCITNLEYKNEDEAGSRVGGYGSARLLMGNFRNEEFDYYTRYSYTKCDSGIVLMIDGKAVVISAENEEMTKKLYNDLKEKM